MTTTSLLMYMTMGEIAIVAIVIAIYFVVRARKSKQPPTTRKTVSPAPKRSIIEPGLQSHIQQLIRQTRKRLIEGDDEHARILEARIQFLEAEAALISGDPKQDSYWDSVSQHLASLFPQQTEVVEDLAQLDDFDSEVESTEIPKGSIVIDTSNEEIQRLRKIISRQFSAIDDLKQSLQDQALSTTQAKTLAEKLEQVEVSQAQLNMCVDVLEKENQRLNELLQSKDPTHDSNEAYLQETRKELNIANDRIVDLEHENSEKQQRIEELENEIRVLEQQLQEHKEQLRQAESLNTDLSHQGLDVETDPDKLREQIESISELLMNKSLELQQLQSDAQKVPEMQKKVQAALHEASTVMAHKSSEVELFNTDEQDDIPVLEPFTEETKDDPFSSAEKTLASSNNSFVEAKIAELGIPPENIDDSDIIPKTSSASLLDQVDDHDIVVEDEYVDTEFEDEVNAFLNSTTNSGDSNTG